jgi:hypothetical protein
VKPILATAALAFVLLASCASDKNKSDTIASAPPPKRSLRERLSGETGYKQDANGNWVPGDDRRSSFESVGQDPNFQRKGIEKKEYNAGTFAKKAWIGGKDYRAKEYAGNTDGGRFQKASALGGQGAREAGRDAGLRNEYRTAGYATGSARETGRDPIATSGNAMIENRQEVFQQPEVVGWRQRNLTVQQSNGILGR